MSHHLIARLLFWPLAAVLLLLLMAPTLGLMALVAYNKVPLLSAWFFELATLAAGGLLLQPSMRYLRQQYSRVALGVLTRRIQRQQSSLTQLSPGLILLLSFGALLRPSPAHAQMRPIEYEQPRVKMYPARTDDLRTVRQLQIELHLNEQDVVRVLEYLHQGYDEAYVRRLFAVNTRKS